MGAPRGSHAGNEKKKKTTSWTWAQLGSGQEPALISAGRLRPSHRCFQGCRLPPKKLSFRLLLVFLCVSCLSEILHHSQFLLSRSTKNGPQGTRRMIEDFAQPELSIFTVRETAQSQEKSSRMPGNMCLLVLVFSQRKQRSPGRKSSISFFFFFFNLPTGEEIKRPPESSRSETHRIQQTETCSSPPAAAKLWFCCCQRVQEGPHPPTHPPHPLTLLWTCLHMNLS